ncbi:MAG TPA: hypothetical protein VIL37_17245 [Natronosporangium sp.]
MSDPADPADLAQGVLLRLADFLRKLPPDQLAGLADGSAKLAVVPKGGRVAAARPAKPAPVSAEQVRAELTRIGDRAGGRRWLEDQKLTVAQLVSLAKELEIAVGSKPRKADVLDKIVQQVIGRRLGLDAIAKAPPRF